MRTKYSIRVLGRCALLTVVSAGPLGGLSAGCGTYRQSRQDVERAVHQWHRPRTTLAQATIGERSSAHVDREEPSPAPSRPVDRYIRQALERNPGIQAAIAEARAKLERIPQVTSLPDPIIRTITRPEPIRSTASSIIQGSTTPLTSR